MRKHRLFLWGVLSHPPQGTTALDVLGGETLAVPIRPGEYIDRHRTAGRGKPPPLRCGRTFSLDTHVSDTATFRVDQGIDPYGRKVSLCSVGAAISRPQTCDLVLLSHDAQTPSPAVGEGLAPPARRKRRFSSAPGRMRKTSVVPPGGRDARPYGMDGGFALIRTFPMR